MNLKELISDERTSITGQGIDNRAYSRTLRHLRSYNFWEGVDDAPHLWGHQQAAIATVVAYLHGDKQIPERPEHTEAALLKLPTGTGKSGIIAILARCLPEVRRVLVLTPRTALTEQLLADIRYRFWSHLGYEANGSALFTAEADVFGTTLDNVYVEQFLPKNVGMVVQHLGDQATDRAILVGTHQALGDIRKTAQDPDDGGSAVAAALLAHIRDEFDLVIVDEGHYEPAISWSRGVREFNLPTLLLSATPYRNDYKSFRVRGRYLFNFPYRQAVDGRIIRPADIIVPEGDVGPVAREAAIPQFVGILHKELLERLREAERWFLNGVTPKVMVRGDDLETLTLLQTEINRVFETQAVVIHDRAKKTQQNRDMFTSVASALRSRPDAKFWIHQNKLMEGIDDPSFVAVAIFDLMGNARQLVQQIGRATRYSRGEDGVPQAGWILSTPANAERIRTTWERYQGYEDYAARNTAHIVTNEVTLPDRLIEYMAEYQYIGGEFRGRFEFEQPLAAGDIQLPRTAAVLRTAAPLPDIRVFATVIEEAIMDKDRFKITPIEGMPDGSMGFSYYAWRNSPYLIDRFFSEWKLGVFLAVQQGEFVFMHDTEGLVVDMDGLSLKRAGRSVMEKAFPESDDNPSRLSRMSFSSLDMSQHAIRAMALRTRSFADAFTDLLDPSLVPATAAGFVNGTARYVGFNRSRLRDASERHVSVADYVTWTKEIAAELADADRERSHVFNRYAALVEDIDDQEAQPVSILLDPSLDDMRDDEAGGARRQDIVEDVGGLFERLDDMARMRAHQRVRIGLLLQCHRMQQSFLVHFLVGIAAQHHSLDDRKALDRGFDQGRVGAGAAGLDHVEHDMVARQMIGIVNPGFEHLEPVSGLRAHIKIRGREHHGCDDVIGQHGDPVGPFRTDTGSVDEDEIRRTCGIDLPDLAIDFAYGFNRDRLQKGRAKPCGFSALLPTAQNPGAVSVDDQDPATGGDSSTDQGARERGLATSPFPGHCGDHHKIVVWHEMHPLTKMV